MRKFYIPILTIFIALIGAQLTQAQLFEDFESKEKAGYASAQVTFESGIWYLDDTLNRSDSGSDMKNGSYAPRIRDGFIRMDFDKPNGAHELSFYAGNSEFSGDGGGQIQVYYSKDSGSTWEELGEEITLAESGFDKYTIAVEEEGDIRFRFNKTAGGRINIDDVSVSDYMELEQNATIGVRVNEKEVVSGDTEIFPETLAGTARTVEVKIINSGEETLEIDDLRVMGDAFSLGDIEKMELESFEVLAFDVTFNPQTEGTHTGTLAISSNAENKANFTLNLSGEAIIDGEIMPIASARTLPAKTRVTVTGRVTVANELGGPAYIQDATGAIPVFHGPLHDDVVIGDSVTVSGPLTYFKPFAGPDSDFSIQIAEVDDDKIINYEVIDTENKPVEPTVVTVQDIVAGGGYNAMLVEIKDVNIAHDGNFQGEQNYGINDGTAEAEIRIDGETNIVGAETPGEPVTLVGVVSKFNGFYQIYPRFTADIGVEEKVYPGDEISKDLTLDIAAWNIEWFGHSNGPEDLELQFENVKTVITTMDMDLYALSEISNLNQFNRLVDELEDYGGFIAHFSSQTQNTAFLFKRSVIDSLSSGLVTDGMQKQHWANGRYPLEFKFNATINDETREFYAYAIHAKAMGDETSYNQRINAAEQLKTFFDTKRNEDNVIALGDFNDFVTKSTFTGNPSPYTNFVEDENYTVLTKSIEESGQGSWKGQSMLDHLIINDNMKDIYMEGTERIENTSYIGSYISTTSDHYPVWARFEYGDPVSNEVETELPKQVTLSQNYPNPFNPTTVINYTLDNKTGVKLQVFDVTGRSVQTLVDRVETSGEHSVTFDASALSSGMYFYRLTTEDGVSLTNKMMLIK